MILGAEMILVWPRASPADSRRSSCPDVPKNFPMMSPIVLPGTLTPDAAAGRLTKKSFACVPTVAPVAPTLIVFAFGFEPTLIDEIPHWIPSPRAKFLLEIGRAHV